MTLNIINNLGSINTNKVNNAMKELRWNSRGKVELWNYLDKDNITIKEESSHLIGCFESEPKEVTNFIDDICLRFKELNNNNYKEFIKEIENFTNNFNIPTIDKRKTKEELLKELENRNTKYKEIEEENKKKDELRKRFNPNNRLVVITLCYNDSDSMTDYYNPCAHIKTWILKEIKDGKKELRILKDIIYKYESLKNLKWIEHKENHSMNHFGYSITSDNCIKLDQPVKAYGGIKEYGFYKVDFSSDGSYDLWNEKPIDNYKDIINYSDDITISRNIEKNGIEIKFNNKPNDDTIVLLKENGFYWSFKNMLWYSKYSDDKLKRMQELLLNKQIMEVV